MINKNDKYYMAIITAIISFFGIIWILKTSGESYVANLYATTPYTWSEILEGLPKTIVFSVIAGIFAFIFFSQIEIMEKKKEEEYRKRREEREKQEQLENENK